MTLDLEGRYRVQGWPAVAVYPLGYKLVRDEDWEWSGIETEDRDWARVIMVGDDAVHLVEVCDLVPLDDSEYCSGCGQIGCGWGH